VAGLVSQPVSLSLPRFQVETGTSLTKLLQTLGMTSAFTPGVADFSGMDGTRNLSISDVIHKAFIHVCGKGYRGRSRNRRRRHNGVNRVPPPTGLPVNANRPFLYYLRDQPTGAILFMGRVQDPSQN